MNKVSNNVSNNSFYTNFFKQDSIGNETRQIFIKYLVATAIVVVCAFTLLNILIHPSTAEYSIQKYFFLYTLPFIVVFALILNLTNNTKAGKLILKLIGIIGLFILGVYLYATSTNSVNIDSMLNSVLLWGIGVIGLAILYKSLINYMEKLKGVYGFIAQLIFYIPCILYDVWEYFIQQVNLTPYSIYLLILVEIILIVIYAFLPDISYQFSGEENSIMLVDNVKYLNEKEIVANSEVLRIPKDKQDENTSLSNDKYYKNYCISMWVFINPQSSTKEPYNVESEIMSYGFTDSDGVQHVKPMLRYYGGGGGDDQLIERNKYIFYFVRYPPVNQYTTDKHTFYDVTLENQKWNQIVLNYNRNNVELYINGDLERTFSMTKNMPTYNDLDTITIGEDNGLDGGICNVVYYKHPLSPEQIALSYNTMTLSNLPVPRKNKKNV